MLSMIPLPYRILGAVAAFIATLAGGFAAGYKVSSDHAAAVQLQAEQAAAAKYCAAVERGNTLSGQLANAETQINALTTEKMRYVHQVTTGKPCLAPSALSLLNSTAPRLSGPTGKPDAEDATGTAATDADTLAWAIDAKASYATCSARLNALIDFENGRE